ncbi:YhcH/YjgK/YiaL family protein [Mucilaginibacter sp. P25]|uniref:YhcH/YjgK/YiaL family protein n=1 Tax=Mucilaginibacter gossypii TaxID=551996 RepID=A0A1G7WFL5_9SPHI|nr:YhcH/YjgK/YiaL family protein [Mucilaginibacter gossypii]SDG70539.1 YhcH/YjgK/YiaL family protein [Mucilaginibacter gossypii]
MIVDSIDNIDFYKSFNKDIYDGLLFIKEAPADIALGEYPISANVKAIVMEYETKVDNGFGYEAHQHVIDIQFPFIGKELVKYVTLDKLEAYTQYDEAKDVTFFRASVPESEVVIGEGIFGIFFPIDAHAPMHCFKVPEYIKKIVIKIKC